MKIADMKVTELINEVGAGTPAPGGGAVAGLAGGVGVALTMMVNGLTLDKKGFENDRERLLDAIAKGNELKERFIDVMNRDSEVFDVLIESLALPKDDDEHKAIRRGAVQASFRNCTLVPLTMMEFAPRLSTCAPVSSARRTRTSSATSVLPRSRSNRDGERMAQRAHQPLVLKGQGVPRRVLPEGRGAARARCTHRPGDL